MTKTVSLTYLFLVTAESAVPWWGRTNALIAGVSRMNGPQKFSFLFSLAGSFCLFIYLPTHSNYVMNEPWSVVSLLKLINLLSAESRKNKIF